MGLFGKSKAADPKLQVQEWCKRIRKEGYGLDRQINGIRREEIKVTKSIKEAAKRGDKDVCRVLAKEVVQSRKAVNKLYTAKANLSSVEMQMKAQASQLRVAGSLQQSAEVMKAMQQLIKLPEIQKTMQDLSKEMMKAGIIEEMLEDVMEMDDTEELEEDVQREVDKVLLELTTDKIKAAPVPAASIDLPEPEREEEPEEAEQDLEDMQERLQALRS